MIDLLIPNLEEQNSRNQIGGDQHEDEWKQAHSGHYRRIAMNKLEVKRDVKERNEDIGHRCCSLNAEEDLRSIRCNVFWRNHSRFGGGEDEEVLLKNCKYEDHATHYEH